MHKTERKDGLFRGDFGVPFELKEMSEDGEFEGYASTFNTVDQGNDMVMPGAYTDTLAKRSATGIKLLFHHRPDKIIGKWLELREDDKGLYAHGKLNLKISQAAEAHEMVKDGQLDGMSIGYKAENYEIDRERGIRKLLKVDLREISLVTFPMETNSLVTRFKSELPTIREFEAFLMREAGLTASQAKAITANGYKSLINARDAGASDDREIFGSLNRLADLFGS